MNDREMRKAAKYVADLAAMYGLKDWRIELHEGDNKEAHDGIVAAEVVCVYGRRLAIIGISPDFPTWEPREQANVVLHELTHVHLNQLATLLEEALPGLIGSTTFHTLMVGYRQAMEHATDAIAEAIAPRFPVFEP